MHLHRWFIVNEEVHTNICFFSDKFGCLYGQSFLNKHRHNAIYIFKIIHWQRNTRCGYFLFLLLIVIKNWVLHFIERLSTVSYDWSHWFINLRTSRFGMFLISFLSMHFLINLLCLLAKYDDCINPAFNRVSCASSSHVRPQRMHQSCNLRSAMEQWILFEWMCRPSLSVCIIRIFISAQSWTDNFCQLPYVVF